MPYILLFLAIISEVFGSTMLKLSHGFSKVVPIIGVIAGFGVSFYFFSLALVDLHLGFSYAVWSGVGTILTAIVAVMLFKERINKGGMLGIGLLLVGVILLNLT